MGHAAASPNAQMVWPSIWPATAFSWCRSSIVALPATMRSSTRCIQPVPSRHGVHWPQDSLWKNWLMRQANLTQQTLSSSTTIAPEPRPEPSARMVS